MEQANELEKLVQFLGEQRRQVLMEKIKIISQLDLSEPDNPTASESAVEE